MPTVQFSGLEILAIGLDQHFLRDLKATVSRKLGGLCFSLGKVFRK